jgi:hypothetical protein
MYHVARYMSQVEGVAEWPIEAGPEFVHGGNALLKVGFQALIACGQMHCECCKSLHADGQDGVHVLQVEPAACVLAPPQ